MSKRISKFLHWKKGKPTVSFQCVVDHNRRVQMCSHAFCGATNDKLIFKTDKETMEVINGK